ncbi:MAG: DMT family transporter [Luteolibacter sp.]
MHLKNDDSFNRRSVMLMLASVVLFATNTLIVRAVAIHAPAANGWVAIVFRGAVGTLVVFALFGWGRGLVPSRLFSSGLIMTRGIVGGLATIAFYVTIVKLGAARAVILNLTYPIFATIIAAVWLKEKISRAAMIWMFVGFLGLVVFLSDDGQLLRPSMYDFIALAGALGAGWVVVIIRRLRHEEHPATIYASQAVFSLLIAAPTAGHIHELPHFAWWGLAGAAVIVTAAQLIMTRAYQFMSVSRGSSLQMLLPLVTALGGFLCFGESFHPVEIAGALLTIFATWRVVTGR